MEKSLMDKIRNHTADDVDKEMILARLKCAHGDLENILTELLEILDRLHRLCADKKDEMSLLDFGFIFVCDDMLIHRKDNDDNGGVPILCTFGRSNTVENLIAVVKKAIDR